ncbi:unnamed protein product, partial [Prorocentrum cordatum]
GGGPESLVLSAEVSLSSRAPSPSLAPASSLPSHLPPRLSALAAVRRASGPRGGGALVAELGDARRRGRQRRPCRPHGGGGGGHPAGRRAASLSGIPRAPGGGPSSQIPRELLKVLSCSGMRFE